MCAYKQRCDLQRDASMVQEIEFHYQFIRPCVALNAKKEEKKNKNVAYFNKYDSYMNKTIAGGKTA